MKKKHRVLFFKPVLNWILGHFYTVLILIFVGITLLLLPLFKSYIVNLLTVYCITLSPFQENILSGLIVAIIPSILTGICFLLKKNSSDARWIKRKLYNACTYLYKNLHAPRVLKNTISYLVNLFYFHNRKLIKTQQYIVNDILNSLNSTTSSQNRVYWIQGSSYSGKTTTILNLLIDLISRKEYNQLFQKLDGNIVYFDLGKLNISLDSLQRDYELEKYSNCLIILDNLHKLPGKTCLDILEKVVLHNHAFALIILLRHPEEFLSENDRVSNLKKIILENGMEYALSKLESHDFEICQENQFIIFCQNFFPLEQVISNDEISIHLYTLYLKKDFDSLKLIPQIQVVLRHNDHEKCQITSELLTIIACSLFTGSFNLSLLVNCLPQTSEVKWKKLLNALTKIGFLTNYPNSTDDFYFHERIAKSYFEVSIKKTEYYDLYIELFQKLSKKYSSGDSPILFFLYCMLAQDIAKAKKVFEHVVTNVNFLNLYAEMMFLFSQRVCNITDYYREIGILCDRCGKLQDARRYYSLYLDTEKSEDAFYKLVQIDHKSITKYPHIKTVALNSSNLYIKILSNYWEIHVNMHRGIFEFQKLYDLACKLQENAEIIVRDHPYDGLHLMRRLYFDLFRLYYLEGIFEPEKLKPFTDNNSKMFRILKYELDEFEAYYIKFAIGLMLGQDILFTLAFDKKGLDLMEYNFLFENRIKIDHSKTCDFRAIANEAIQIYLQAIEMFDKIGDKTSIFVKYHMYNVKMLLVEDGNFSECERFYEDYMAFAIKENILEYQAYAETFKLKMSLIQLCSPAIISTYGNDQYDELKNTIQQKLELAKKYEELANPGYGNKYSQLRLALYSALFSFFIKKISIKKFEREIQCIKKVALDENYNRELKIIKYIEKYNYQLSPESIRIIFSFYPIVPQ
nr:hypothetical protein [uncultured Acetatifactor sp.]